MKLKKFVVEALLGFVIWTLFLTPYMILITKVTFEQYLAWLVMQGVLVPPIAVVVVNITNWLTKKLGLK